MANERLRSAILTNGYGLQSFAEGLGVDRKTVDRWIAGRNLPYRRHQFDIAAKLGLDVAYLWPEAHAGSTPGDVGQAELLTLYPHRSAVPDAVWLDLLDRAKTNIDVLVYSGMYLAESTTFHQIARSKAKAGATVRILLGDPDGENIARRGDEEGIGDAMAARVHNAIVLFKKLRTAKGLEFRCHDTVLYNSIIRGDGDLLVNTHVQGLPAYQAPVMHLRRVPGADLVSTYLDSFERVWENASPCLE